VTRTSGLGLAVTGVVLLGVACASSGAGGRRIEITQTDGGCSPASIAATPGEKLNLVVKNNSGSDAYEMEGIEGTNLEEVAVHKNKTLSVGYEVPSSNGVHKIKCYVPAGTSTIIEVVVGGGAVTEPPASATSGATPASEETARGGAVADPSVAVTLVEYSVAADKPTVKAGKIRFIATNASATQVHELAVLRVKADGSFDNLGEIEGIDPGAGGSVDLDLTPGAYVLACLIAPGEAGSTVDHYQQGMHTPFTVE